MLRILAFFTFAAGAAGTFAGFTFTTLGFTFGPLGFALRHALFVLGQVLVKSRLLLFGQQLTDLRGQAFVQRDDLGADGFTIDLFAFFVGSAGGLHDLTAGLHRRGHHFADGFLLVFGRLGATK